MRAQCILLLLSKRKTYSLTRPSIFLECQLLGGEAINSERWGLKTGQACSSILKIDFMGLSALLEKFYGIMNRVKENAIELKLDLQDSSLHSMRLLPGGFFIHPPLPR